MLGMSIRSKCLLPKASAGSRFPLSVSLTTVLLVAMLALSRAANTTKHCDSANPTNYNCLTSCKRPCTTAHCQYRCHYDTMYELLSLAVTPPEGASLPAFKSNVMKLSLYLDENVTLRIDPVGVYSGRTMVADYIATFVHPLGLGSRVSVAAVDITHFANTEYVAASTINLQYFVKADPTRRITNLTGMLFSRFNPYTQKLAEGDWNFVRFPQFQEALNNGPRVSDETSAVIVAAVCQVDATVCKPLGYGGYDNVTDCQTFMKSIPKIAPYGIQGNNQYCRFLHLAYATVDPQAHCPHISRSGGGVCVDQIYNDYYKVFPTYEFIGGAKRPVTNRRLLA